MNNMIHKKQLVIIAGVAGEIGTEFAQKLVSDNIETLGIIRNKAVSGIDSPLFKTVACHLDNPEHVEQVFSQIDLARFDRIIYLHTWLSSALPMAGSVRLEMVPAVGQVSYQDRMCYWQTPEQETALTWGPNAPAICMGSPAYNAADGRSLERGPGGDAGNCMHALDDAATGYVLSPETPQGLSAQPTW